MQNKNILDLLKYLLSLVVVSIHLNLQEYSFILFKCAQLAVPVFFIISGYLLRQKYETSGLSKYLKKSIILYIVWTVLYLPLTVYGIRIGYMIGDNPITSFLIGTFIVGENYLSWPLWYLYALIGGTVILGFFKSLHIKIDYVVVTSMIISALGFAIDEVHHNNASYDTFLVNVVEGYFSTGMTTRNFLFFAFPYMSIGLFISKYEYRFAPPIVFSLLIMLMVFPYYSNCIFAKELLSGAIVVALLRLSIFSKAEPSTFRYIRSLSVLIYFSHMYIVFLITKLLMSSFLVNFILAVFITNIISVVIMHVSNKPKLTFIRRLLIS